MANEGCYEMIARSAIDQPARDLVEWCAVSKSMLLSTRESIFNVRPYTLTACTLQMQQMASVK